MRTRNLFLLLLLTASYPSLSKFIQEPDYRKLAEYNLIKQGYTRLLFLDNIPIGCKDTPSYYWSVEFTAYKNSKQVSGTYCTNIFGPGTSIDIRD